MDNDVLKNVEIELGWDHAMYGCPLPESLGPIAYAEYGLGKAHFAGTYRKADRYVRKWLQLRTSAFLRRRLVNEDVTPQFIELIDTSQCPVTLVALTHGELLDSDWSVDRLNNNGAYARDNLAVISTKANTAKGAKSFEEVLELSRQSEPSLGLKPREWLRMACLMFGPSVIEDKTRDQLLPLATRIPKHVAHPEWFRLQYCIVLTLTLKTADRSKQRKDFQTFSRSDAINEAIDSVYSRLEMLRRDVLYPYDAMVDERVQAGLRKWFLGLDTTGRRLLKEYMLSTTGGSLFSKTSLRGFSLGTRGYVSRKTA